MDLLTIGLAIAGAVILLIALLVARGMWLIGQGTDTELEARTKMADNTIGLTGWGFLDWLRTADFAPVVWVEEKLGLESPTDRCRTHGCTEEPVPGYRVCHDHLDGGQEP